MRRPRASKGILPPNAPSNQRALPGKTTITMSNSGIPAANAADSHNGIPPMTGAPIKDAGAATAAIHTAPRRIRVIQTEQ